jgi:hypothetical protein
VRPADTSIFYTFLLIISLPSSRLYSLAFLSLDSLDRFCKTTLSSSLSLRGNNIFRFTAEERRRRRRIIIFFIFFIFFNFFNFFNLFSSFKEAKELIKLMFFNVREKCFFAVGFGF